jgi:hypothetical protein
MILLKTVRSRVAQALGPGYPPRPCGLRIHKMPRPADHRACNPGGSARAARGGGTWIPTFSTHQVSSSSRPPARARPVLPSPPATI